MPSAIFEHPDGDRETVDIPEGWTLMEGARRDEIAGIDAECGGGAICGTCHVQVDGAWLARLKPADASESALLGIVPERTEGSRLACQIVMDDSLDGIVVRVPAEQLGL